jgi:hypothetical protein
MSALHLIAGSLNFLYTVCNSFCVVVIEKLYPTTNTIKRLMKTPKALHRQAER